MLKFRNKEEKIGLFLGCTCFIPIFFMNILLIDMRPVIGTILLIITQFLWLFSITLCTRSLEIENRLLKEQLKRREDK